MKRRSLFAPVRLSLVVLSVAGLLLSGCGSGSPKTSSAKPPAGPQDTLVVAQGADTRTLDPQKQGDMISVSVLINIFDTLLTRDNRLQLAPSLATEWKALNDTTWQFKLREGVKFHDGEPFNAQAVKFSIERILDPKTKSPIIALKSVKQVDIVDDHTVNIVTKTPDPLIPVKMTLFPGIVVPPKYIQDKGDAYFAQHPVGTGPFKFVEWKKDDRVMLEANPDYWRGTPKVKKLVFRAIPNDADRVAALMSGEVDVISNLPPDSMATVNQSQGAKAVAVPGVRAQFVALDSRSGPLAKQEVRQALNYALDVDSIVKNVLGGLGERLPTFIPKQAFGYDPQVKPYPHDPQKARELLKAAGYPDGFKIQLATPSGLFMKDKDVAQAIAGQLAKVGIKVDVQVLEAGTFTSQYMSDKIAPMYLIGNLSWMLDSFLNLQSYGAADRRYARMPENPELSQLMKQQETSMDPAVRQQALSKIQHTLKDQAYYLYLYTTKDVYGLTNRVQWTPPSNQLLWMYEASLKPEK